MEKTPALPQVPADTTEPVTNDNGSEWSPVRVDVLGFIAGLALQRRVIAAITAMFLVGSVVVAFLTKPYYEAQATFLPPARESGSLGSVGGLSPNTLLAMTGLGFSQGAAYLGFLRSRSVQDGVARDLHVQETFHIKNAQDAGAFVAAKARFDVQTDGIVSVTCRDTSPQFAAQLANAYLEALYKLNQRMSATAIAQRSEFYNQELAQARAALENAEANLVSTQQRVGVLEPGSTAQVAISTEARLNASIQATEVQLAALLQSQTESSPEVVRLRSQISQLRAQLSQQQSSVSGANARNSQPNGTLPQISVQSVRSARAVREREAIYEALLRQADVARLSESDPGPQLQVIDEALVPLTKAGPSRRSIVVQGTLLGLILALVYVTSRGFIISAYSQLVGRIRDLQHA